MRKARKATALFNAFLQKRKIKKKKEILIHQILILLKTNVI
jgi:hypothetical protein